MCCKQLRCKHVIQACNGTDTRRAQARCNVSDPQRTDTPDAAARCSSGCDAAVRCTSSCDAAVRCTSSCKRVMQWHQPVRALDASAMQHQQCSISNEQRRCNSSCNAKAAAMQQQLRCNSVMNQQLCCNGKSGAACAIIAKEAVHALISSRMCCSSASSCARSCLLILGICTSCRVRNDFFCRGVWSVQDICARQVTCKAGRTCAFVSDVRGRSETVPAENCVPAKKCTPPPKRGGQFGGGYRLKARTRLPLAPGCSSCDAPARAFWHHAVKEHHSRMIKTPPCSELAREESAFTDIFPVKGSILSMSCHRPR